MTSTSRPPPPGSHAHTSERPLAPASEVPPALAFPVRLASPVVGSSTRWLARRGTTARRVGRGRYAADGGALVLGTDAGTPGEVQAAALVFSAGLALLRDMVGDPIARDALRALDGAQVELLSGAEHLLEVDRERRVVAIDAGLPGQLGLQAKGGRLVCAGLGAELGSHASVASDQDVADGFLLLSALAHAFAASCLQGRDRREALHQVLDLHASVASRERALTAALGRSLRTPGVDHQNTFGLFLESAFDARLAQELEGAAVADLLGEPLEALRSRGQDPARPASEVAAVTAAIKWRDKWVTWLLGRDLTELPYDQERVFRLLEERDGEDIDAKRRAIHQEIASTYDRRIEGQNIERLSREIEAQGRMIVCGRISRAFGNQTQLLSNAAYVDRTRLRPLVAELERKTAAWPELGPQVSRIVKLVRQPGNASSAQLRGGLWHLEEALRELQSSTTRKINASREADVEKLVGRLGFAHYQEQLERLSRRIGELFALTTSLREALEVSPRRPAAFLILQQRFFPGETQLLALANANRDTHPGKIEVLRDLTRKGGHNRYASEGFGVVEGPDGKPTQVSWISKCQHWIEAIPMFIKERIVKVPVSQGGEQSFVERIETEVDQRGMEAFFRYAAEHWAENCREVADSEHVAIAREWLVRQSGSSEWGERVAQGEDEDQAFLTAARELGLLREVGAAAALVAASAEVLVDRVGVAMEKRSCTRFHALRALLLGPGAASATEGNVLAAAAEHAAAQRSGAGRAAAELAGVRGLDGERTRLDALAQRRRRPLSTLHVLTTESAGMTEGYVQTWLETEMALHNVIRAQGWQGEVQKRQECYRTRISALADEVVRELGMEAVVQEVMNENGVPRAAALSMVLATHRPVADEVSRLGVLIEDEERRDRRPVEWGNVQDPPAVDAWIAEHRERLEALAVPKVIEGNGRAIQQALETLASELRLAPAEAARAAIDGDPDFAADLAFHVRSLARQELLEAVDRELPELSILKTQADYLRNHTQLALTTARRAVVAAHGAQGLTEDPRYNFRASGGKKRYNLLYTPSRVDLGAEEMDSIVRWNQWVGGADRAACNAGRDFYALINEAGVEVRPALAWQEIQKTSENANMTAGKAFANAVALLINSVDEGDQQLMADQMALRHDPDRGTPAASEGYGGYCVPKDGLFLAFVLELRNETKLRQMGVPPSMHQTVMALAREAILHYSDFETDFEWQRWVGQKLLAQEHLRRTLSGFVGVRRQRDEDLLVFNVSKIAESIQHLGQPWQDVSGGDRLVSNLAAQWAVGKMIVGGEQIQRFMVFYKAWLVARALREAGREGQGRVVTPAEYKTVQDIRYSGGIRIFEILSRTGEHLTYSLDEEGQDLVFLMMYGYTPSAATAREAAAIQALPAGSEERLRRQRVLDRQRRVARRLCQVYSLDEQRDAASIAQLAAKFPPMVPPADIRLVSSTMASTQDVFYYTDDTQLTQIADRVLQALTDVGLAEGQLRANAQVHGGDLARWTGIRELPGRDRQVLLESSIVYRVGADTFEVPMRGAIHALVLKLLGPARIYQEAIQGADVLNTSIAFPELLELVDDPPRLVALMLEGNARSALAITDGISGRGSRMLAYRDVMLFFAACDSLAGPGRGSYRAIGLGDHVVARLRAEMSDKRQRAAELLQAIEAVGAAAGDQALAEATRGRAGAGAASSIRSRPPTRRWRRSRRRSAPGATSASGREIGSPPRS